ncbi:MAG: type II toxin-antitoxin system VapC family toxin [Fimbriimonas sp.]
MTPCLVDSNVLLDVLSEDPQWFEWSATTLETVADSSRLIINPVIYAEVSIRYSTIEELEIVLPKKFVEREPIPFEAAFLAGKCFREYRKRGGMRTSTLPDFFIGAHATVAGYRLLTRDVARYRTYFPNLVVIAPG